MVDREDGKRPGVGSVVGAVEEVRGSEGSGFGIGERSIFGGWRSGRRDSGRGIVEGFGGEVAWGREVTEGELGGLSRDVAGDRLEQEELAGEELRDVSARVGGRSAGCESRSRDRERVEESSSERRALARSASQGKLVRAAGQLALGGGRPERLIGDNVRQIETCIRPRSYLLGEQEGFASYASFARLSLRSESVVVDRGDRDGVETTGCPRTRYRTTYPGVSRELCSRKNVVRRVPEQSTEQD